jgi:hypothetical protein
MLVIEEQFAINPDDLLVVSFQFKGRLRTRTAYSICYVPVELDDGTRVVAVEILFDPKRQQPVEPYVCKRLEQILIGPRSLKRVQPYVVE